MFQTDCPNAYAELSRLVERDGVSEWLRSSGDLTMAACADDPEFRIQTAAALCFLALADAESSSDGAQ
jgi:hypothetical protein